MIEAMAHSTASSGARAPVRAKTSSTLRLLNETAVILTVALGMTLLALLVRWPNLQLIPAMTDETGQVAWAFRIAQGEHFPLTDQHAYIGIIYPYLLALLLKLFGPHADLPRIMMAVQNALLAGLVVVWTWLITRLTSQEDAYPSPLVAAAIAGGLVVTSFQFIVLSSHVAWSNGLTPLFVTAALASMWWAVTHDRPVWLLPGAFAWNLALQAHPSAVVLAPGAILWTLWQPTGRRWLRTRWPWLALLVFLLSYGNMLWYNLAEGHEATSQWQDPRHSFGLALAPLTYLERVTGFALQLARTLAGSYLPFDGDNPPVLITPLTPVMAVWATLALLWAARRWETALLTWTSLSMLLVTSLFSDGYSTLYQTRFVANVLPLIYIATGLAMGEAWRRRRALARVAVGLGAIFLILAPLVALSAFYSASEAKGLTNARFLHVVGAARQAAAQGDLVLLDRDADDIQLGGSGDPDRAMRHYLTLEGIPHQFVRIDKIRYYLENSEAPLFLILGSDTVPQLDRYPLAATALSTPGYRVFTAPPPR